MAEVLIYTLWTLYIPLDIELYLYIFENFLAPSTPGKKIEPGPKKSMKEVCLLQGSNEDDDNEVSMINGFDPEVPISLQAYVGGMQNQFKKRRDSQDPERSNSTPPIETEDSLL